MNDMRHEKLIVRFLKAAASPAGVMRCKHTFSWLEISFLFMFLTACLTAPVSIALMKMDRFNAGNLLPNVVQKADAQFIKQLKGYQLTNGRLTGTDELYRVEKEKTLLAVDLKHELKTSGENGRIKAEGGYQNALIFQSDHLIISDQSGAGFSVRYPAKAGLNDLDADHVGDFIGAMWFAQYKPLIIMLACSAVFIISLFVTAVLTGGIWISKKSNMTGIRSFKEAAAAAVCGSALPAAAAMAFGMIRFDFIMMLLIHSCGSALMVSFIFRHIFKTRHHNENLQSGGNHGKSAAI
ncbi:DUF1189 family protein [Bacillus paralicheniformis]|jgi:maltodextrin utilization protein YvdJ|uniref:Maltodextrose utilization protein MalA n=1 Tax=Bacillus paralicheniformis TaxID=1648923 RepID=A0A6I7TP26_9BACI|nr:MULTISPECIES: DUF1189 family protein [Bacillus]KJD54219.1 maltodextrin utilization protein yvdJ [Bacillus amyloliquefaciens]KUL08081.1 maltodextrin utilization protein yvdJ [Bacillus licheniformis LMG 7559]KUL15394.1 maltodextrin utilization protein yvdJ [Bacillus licheniformis LMG 6934]AGN35147.1 putative maltodextrin utilization protein YvdJ [Bacillus paralicheniformis ATCC 9945a]ARA87956.1 DUF1189 domain-containing protein [Bacillus paralicheniformis]